MENDMWEKEKDLENIKKVVEVVVEIKCRN